jgi:hypothetical protein
LHRDRHKQKLLAGVIIYIPAVGFNVNVCKAKGG